MFSLLLLTCISGALAHPLGRDTGISLAHRRAVRNAHEARATAPTCAQTYTVVAGDVCHAIAKAHGMTTKQLMSANAFIDVNCLHLQIGAQLCVAKTSSAASNSTSTNSTVNVQSVNAIATGNTATSTDGWTLHKTHAGKSFFDGFTFYGDWSSSDPTHGSVSYVNSASAWNDNLVSTTDNTATMTIEQGANNWNRKSIRIQSDEKYNAGTLLLLDASHVPAGKGLWPAFWTTGDSWPNNGEIDILEYVNEGTLSQTSFHTNDGCSMQSTGFSGTLTDGTYCSSYATGNSGCGVATNSPAGSSFNQAGGGVYALVWTSSSIATYFFARNAIPADIAAGAPVPSSWGQPTAMITSQACDLTNHFRDHSIIFDTTTCGDWAGAAFDGGADACKSYMANADLSEAYWTVNSLQVFTQ